MRRLVWIQLMEKAKTRVKSIKVNKNLTAAFKMFVVR